MGNLCNRFTDLLVRDWDTPPDIKIKRGLTPILGIVTVFNLLIIVMFSHSKFQILSQCVSLLGLALYFVPCFTTAVSMRRMLDVVLLCYTVSVLLGDLVAASLMTTRVWSMVILTLDAALVFERDSVTLLILALTLVYLAAERAEASLQYGLYEAPDWGATPTIPYCDCPRPPCSRKINDSFGNLLVYSLILVVDFRLTRGFSNGLRTQLRFMEATVRVAEKVAASLAQYQVDDAEAAIMDEGKALPQALRVSFVRLLANLNAYKDYLPESLLLQEESEAVYVAAPGMGMDETPVTMVFSDIQSSTSLWEAFPTGMHEALGTHNRTMRAVATENGGYECKVIGDAFMLAFPTPAQGVEFGLDAQVRLTECTWPADLCSHRLCERVEGTHGVPMWHGVRVRIGVHHGVARVERNPVSGRYDYFGPPVNTAARVEAALKHGGLTGITSAVLEELGGSLQRRGDVRVYSLGSLELKGVANAVSVHVVLKSVLAGRWAATQNPLIEINDPKPLGTPRRDSTPSTVSKAASDTRAMTSRGSMEESSRATPPVAAPAPHVRLALRMSSQQGTVGVVRAGLAQCPEPNVPRELSELLAATETAAARSQGVVVAVVSLHCVVGWNTLRRCADHILQSMHFINNLAPRWSHWEECTAHLGAMTGHLLAGNIAAGRRRYATVVGTAVELSIMLAEEAALRRLPGLAAGPIGEAMHRDEGASSFGEWEEQGGDAIPVWAVRIAAASETAADDAPTAHAQSQEPTSRRIFPPSFISEEADPCAGSRRCSPFVFNAQ
eukprot:Hpha_TRINITY_DN13526_c0_g1::TRINITY_DN13526_c0_g1_i1::g.111373::m.111373